MRTTERKAVLREFFRNEMDESLDKQINAVLNEMSHEGVSSEKYSALAARLEQLTKIKTSLRRNPVSTDTIALIAGNLLGILLIVAYEQKHVMMSKGFNQIIRPR